MSEVSQIQGMPVKDAQARNDLITYPYYNVLKNGGNADGGASNDNIIENAKTEGYRKFYFPQNITNNANYYFDNVPELNNCEIISDNGVILNFPNPTGIDKTKNAIFKNDVLLYSRVQNKTFVVPKNCIDLYNNVYLPNYSKIGTKKYELSELKLFDYDYFNSKLFIDNTTEINNKYEITNAYMIKSKTIISGFPILAVPIKKNNQCVECVSDGNGTILRMGILNSSTGRGLYILYGDSNVTLYTVDGSSADLKTAGQFNISKHNMIDNNNNYQRPMKMKLRYKEEINSVQIFINDTFISEYCVGVENPDYFGFGFANTSDTTIIDNWRHSFPVSYVQGNIPLNANLKILIAGDSRIYGYDSNYRIEKILKDNLMLKSINKIEIDNISVSGWTIENVYAALNERDLSQYDIVIVPIGINNFNSSFESITTSIYQVVELCKANKCIAIVPSCMPASTGTDELSTARKEQYFKIQSAITLGCAYVEHCYVRNLDNICGTVAENNNLEITADGVHPNNYGIIELSRSIVNGILHLWNY